MKTSLRTNEMSEAIPHIKAGDCFSPVKHDFSMTHFYQRHHLISVISVFTAIVGLCAGHLAMPDQQSKGLSVVGQARQKQSQRPTTAKGDSAGGSYTYIIGNFSCAFTNACKFLDSPPISCQE